MQESNARLVTNREFGNRFSRCRICGASNRVRGREMTNEMAERLTIREMVENWVVWRDAMMWDKFRSLWHEDGIMMATWTQGNADHFIEMSKQGFAKGVRILHFLGGSSIEVKGDRALSQTKMTIS